MRNFKFYREPFTPSSIIKDRDELFRVIFEESPDAIFLLQSDSFDIIDCNAKAVQLFEAQEKEEMIGRRSFSLYEAEPVEFSRNTFIETINNGKEYSQELAFRSLRGNVFWGKCSLHKVDIVNGGVIVFRVRRVIDYMKTAEMLTSLIKHTAKVTGMAFFTTITELLAKAFGASMAIVARINTETGQAETVHAWHKAGESDRYSFGLLNSPSYNVLKGYTTFYPNNLKEMFPEDRLIAKLHMESYMGTPVFDSEGKVSGLLILMDDKPMEEIPNSRYMLTLMALRAGIELERIAWEELLKNRINELDRASAQKDQHIQSLQQQLDDCLNTTNKQETD
jgi:PAS domain S-box-containing protein